MPRTRLTAATAALVLLAAAFLAGCGSDGTPAPLSGRAEDRLATIARRVLDGDVSSAEPLQDVYWRVSGPRTVGVDVRLNPTEGDDGDLVRLTRGPATPVPPCNHPDRCKVSETPAGTQVVAWDVEAPEEDPGYVSVALHGPEDTRTILLAGPTITSDPRTTRLPYVGSVEGMLRILVDPAFTGVRLREPAPAAHWTPRALAALVQSRMPATYSFHERPGGIGFRAYGPVVSLVFLTGGDAATGCPAEHTCTTDGDLTYAWAPGRAVLLRTRDGYVVRIGVAQRDLDLTGPDDVAEDEVLRQLVALTADPELAPELSTDWQELGDEVDWTGPG